MINAWNILYPERRISTLAPTDYYIRFKPKTATEVYDLKSNLQLTLFDFPLDHYVIKMGDYYHDPSSGAFDFYYGIVSANVQLPDTIEYDILDNLYLSNTDIDLIVVSMINENFSATEINDYVGPIDPGRNQGIITPPDIQCDPPCILKLRLKDDILINGKPQYEYYCDCTPGNNENNPTSQFEINDCGCIVYSNDRKPGGCVTVEDVHTSTNVGVRKAKIIVKNTSNYDDNFNSPWTWVATTYTSPDPDSLGCWKINRMCSAHNNIHVWVEFNNEKAYIRGPHFDPQRYVIPVADYVGEINGPNYNDIEVHYPLNTEETQAQRYWVSATIINTIDQMHRNCLAEGMNVPPHLDFFHMNIEMTPAAWMAHYGGVHAIASLLIGTIPSMLILPDIFLNRNRINLLRGDVFHESSHASHYTNVGPIWYNVLTSTEFFAGGHGNGTELGAGYVAVAESWADHIEVLFDEGNPVFSERCENLILENNGFVPEGLHYDLFDQGVEPLNTGITDNVSGFTNEMIFNILTSEVRSIPQMRTHLWNNFHTDPGVNATQIDYNTLFNSYGY